MVGDAGAEEVGRRPATPACGTTAPCCAGSHKKALRSELTQFRSSPRINSRPQCIDVEAASSWKACPTFAQEGVHKMGDQVAAIKEALEKRRAYLRANLR